MNLKPYEIEKDFTIPIYMDTEFTSLSKDGQLLSIGLINEDDEYFYAEISYEDDHNIIIDDWIRDNVVKNFINVESSHKKADDNFIKCDTCDDKQWGCRYTGTKEFISEKLKEWLDIQYKKYTIRSWPKELLTDMYPITVSTFEELDEQMRTRMNELNMKFAPKKLQIYADCLAYDWMLFVDLISGSCLNLPEYIYYIPYDLSSVLQACKIDPDIQRESFVDNYKTGICYGKNKPIDIKVPFILRDGMKKHNALWDAYICKYIFKILKSNDIA